MESALYRIERSYLNDDHELRGIELGLIIGEEATSEPPKLFEPPKFPADILPEKRPIGFAKADILVSDLDLLPVTQKPARAKVKAATKRKKSVGNSLKTTKKAKPGTKAKLPKKTSVKKASARKRTPIAPIAPAAPSNRPFMAKPLIAATEPYVESIRQSDFATPELTTPLPRSKSVAIYRRNNFLDGIAYWMRKQVSGLSVLTKPRIKRVRKQPSIGHVLAENAALRAEIERLRAQLVV